MRFVHKFINKEISDFKKLHQEAQRLLASIMLFNLIVPIFTIFVNAFLWRQSHDMMLVAFFNLILYTFIPVAFYLNGFLLKKFSPNRICYTALALEGIAITSLIFFSQPTYLTVLFFGTLYSLTAGIYWANRNLLKIKTTQSNEQIYFTGLEASSNTITGVFIPLFIGWFITFGTIIHLYTPIQGYQLIALMMLVIITAIGFVMHGHTIKHTVGRLLVTNVSKNWKQYRLLEFTYGLGNGMVIFVPTLMVLLLVGNEATLGTIQSLSAIIASMIIYIIGKYLGAKHRILLFAIGAGLLILGGMIFGLLFSAIAVAVFFACSALAQPFGWVAISSFYFDLIDKNKEEDRYAYICDVEIYLNSGRIVGIGLFIIGISLFSSETALRFTPLFMGISQVLIFLVAHATEKHYAKVQPAPALSPEV